MTPFDAKNENRRKGREHGTRAERTEARRLRRSVLGSFGDASRADWNLMVYGTTGSPK